MEFQLLGAIQAYVDGRPAEVGHARQRCVLANLLVEANQVVAGTQLVDRVWSGHRLPARREHGLFVFG
ncbi:AfsR/SARP family transcriptional regulator [Actinophytocola glycyrrhizae]|uniref:Uncharacterized protein n=1 Tax=Actinophytocola glycyrrhizae TaxID=2044873 RepID=A0ABV9RUL9_9PSEU